MTRSWFVLGSILVFVGLCTSRANALTEFCPAGVSYAPAEPASGQGQSTSLAIWLNARAPRTILSATVVADTDGGWYTWDVNNVALSSWSVAARSAPLAVDFPKPVFVRHAWVVKARTSGDRLFGWDALGEAACGLPAFGVAAYRPARPVATTGLVHVSASPIAPLYSTNCTRPFAPATVAHAVQPRYPSEFILGGVSSFVKVEIQVGDNDNLVDAWIYQSSKNSAVDESALAAARASTYKSAISYCQKANGDYIFRAEFRPY